MRTQWHIGTRQMSHGLLIALAFAGMAARALIPAGFMPAPLADGWPVQLCPGLSGNVLLPGSGKAAAPGASHDRHADHDYHGQHADHDHHASLGQHASHDHHASHDRDHSGHSSHGDHTGHEGHRGHDSGRQGEHNPCPMGASFLLSALVDAADAWLLMPQVEAVAAATAAPASSSLPIEIRPRAPPSSLFLEA